ncbi:hypothetical protein [Sinorhizobium meliloti]|uniref:hypothetical protein n=1 Tax=Rhizobium meliloti TaxID=382 RepID=UPI0013E2B5FF|nr:hypothetical protein [Sinorhizobium meliloti]
MANRDDASTPPPLFSDLLRAAEDPNGDNLDFDGEDLDEDEREAGREELKPA